ncbi:putative endo-polygalacturonase [Helianthus anomalus]
MRLQTHNRELIVYSLYHITTIFDVVQYGAKGDGIVDDSPAFIAAWKAACQSTTNATSILNIPVGRTYLLKPIAFSGPCKPSKIFVQVYI